MFCIEPMQNFHLGLSQLLNQTATECIRPEDVLSFHLSSNSSVFQSFKSTRSEILRELNKFLRIASSDPVAYNVNVDFSFDGSKDGFKEYFVSINSQECEKKKSSGLLTKYHHL